MGMSTSVVGFKPPDEKWQQMKAAWDACQAAGVAVPDEVDAYFGGEEPDPEGVEVEEDALTAAGALRPWQRFGQEGYEVIPAKLPPDVTVVRVYNSW